MTREEVLQAIDGEARRAVAEYGQFSSMHEAWGILQEEHDELTEAIRMKQFVHEVSPKIGGGVRKLGTGRQARIRNEAIQCAAMCLLIAEQAETAKR